MRTLLSLTSRKPHFGVFFQLHGGIDGGMNPEGIDHNSIVTDTRKRLGRLLGNTGTVVAGVALSVLAVSSQAGGNEPSTAGITTDAPSVLAAPAIGRNGAVNTTNPPGGDRKPDIPVARKSEAETFLDGLGIVDPKVRALIKSGDPKDIVSFVGRDPMGFGNTIIELHKEYIACILADEITAALKGTAHEIIVPSIMLYTKDGIPEAQSDTLEEKHPYLFAKYMEWHTAFLKEQIGYAQEIVRVQANTKRIEELTALFRQMNAQNAGLLKSKI